MKLSIRNPAILKLEYPMYFKRLFFIYVIVCLCNNKTTTERVFTKTPKIINNYLKKYKITSKDIRTNFANELFIK